MQNIPIGVRATGNNHSETRRFSVFEVDLRAGKLRRNGMKVKLQEQPFQVLTLLLERPGEVVTREEVRDRLWPANTFVDFDHSLNAAIRRLRDALGDSAENPTFVETVARRGYRFLAPVTNIPANGNGHGAVHPVDDVPATPSPGIGRGWLAIGAAAVCLVVIGIVLGLRLAPRDPAPARVTRLTANPVDDPIVAAAVSRDGRYLAFADSTGFYLRQIDTGETHAMALPDGLLPNSISWFPDNVHMILGLCGVDRPSSLWEVSALGGSARKMVDDGEYPAISPDGRRVAFIVGRPLRQRIWLADTDGEQAHELAGTDGDLFGRIGWSPDGRSIAYTTARFSYGYGAEGKIAVVNAVARSSSAPTSQPRIILSRFGLGAPLVWAADGTLIFTTEESRPRQADSNLWSVRLNDQLQPDCAPVRLTSDQGSVVDVSASSGNQRVTYIKGIPEPDVYVGELEPSGTLTEPQRLTLDDRQDLPFDWTPDSKEVIFVSDRTGMLDIYKQDIHKAVPDLLVAGNQSAVQPRLSPDGSQILYVLNPSWGDPDFEVPLMRVPFAGGAPQQITKAKWISNHQCARAPATACLYSVVNDSALTFFRFDPMTGEASQVFQVKDELPQLFNWSLSPDGTTLAIAKKKSGEPQPRIHLLSLVGSSERWLTVREWPGLGSLDWAADSKSLWATTETEKGNALLRIDLQGNARLIWRPKKQAVRWAIPSRDGKYLALHVNSSTANVWMLEH